jgi:ATP-dependent RNA helicase DeaD
MFSATMSKGIMQITKNYQKNAKVIKSADSNKTVAAVDQWHVHMKKADKAFAVSALINYHEPKLTLIFCNTKRMVDTLVKSMQQKGVSAVALHGDLNQNARNRVMNGFRSGAMPILIATDVAARGIDVDNVELVINYDIPADDEYYVHRIGRTGRAGRGGLAVTLISGNEQKKRLQAVERFTKARIPKRQLPSQAEISKKKNDAFVETFLAELELPVNDKYFNLLDSLKSKGYSERKIGATLLKMLQTEKKALQPARFDSEVISSGAREANMVRFFINVGKKDKISSADIVGCVAGEAGISGSCVGKVDIFENFSFVEVQQQYKQKVLDGINNNKVRIRNRDISIDVAKARK